jgi:hypothetical protein
MKVQAIWEFDADVEELDSKFVDKVGLAKDLTERELAYLLSHNSISADDFEYSVVAE